MWKREKIWQKNIAQIIVTCFSEDATDACRPVAGPAYPRITSVFRVVTLGIGQRRPQGM